MIVIIDADIIDVGELTSENDIKQLIEEIENKDRVLIRNKTYLESVYKL